MIDWLRGSLLGAVDRLNIAASPFRAFDRPADISDTRILSIKALAFWNNIQNGFLFGPQREFYWSMKPNDLGDAAIWQGWYLATCVFKGDWPAAELALRGCERLQYLGGNSRLCRGADLHPDLGGSYAVDPSRKHYRDGDYAFVDNCSESSLLGQLLGYWAVLYRDDVPEDLKVRARASLVDLAQQIHSDGCRLLNQDGSPARFGDLRPSVTAAPIRLASLACLFVLAHKASGSEVWGERYDQLMRDHGQTIMRCETHILWIHPWYQDLLSYMALPILATMDSSAVRRRELRDALAAQWEKNKEEGNALYAFMVKLAAPGTPWGQDKAIKTLSEFNAPSSEPYNKHPSKPQAPGQPLIKWGFGKKAMTVSRQPIPVWRRGPQDFVWQRCPYSPGNEEHHHYNGLDFCAAYYLGRYLGALQ